MISTLPRPSLDDASMALTHLEDPGRACVEVVVAWGDAVLHVAHLPPGRGFELASEGRAGASRFVVDRAMLGDARVAVVAATRCGPKFTPWGDESEGASGAIPMRPGAEYRAGAGALTVTARVVPPGVRVGRSWKSDTGLLASGALAAGLVGTVLAVLVAATPGSGLINAGLDEDRLSALRAFVQRVAERVPPAAPVEREGDDATSSLPNAGAPGRAGALTATARNGRLSVRGSSPNTRAARVDAREAVAGRGVFASLGPNAASNPFAAFATSEGHDAASTHGLANGLALGDMFGFDGLGHVGTGAGRGGDGPPPVHMTMGGGGGWGATCGASWSTRIVRGRSVTVATRDDGCEAGTMGRGYANAGTLVQRRPGVHEDPRDTHAPLVRAANPEVSGIDPSLIRRVVLRNIGQVEHCHTQGLAQDPGLSGRVVVRFVLRHDGTVLGASVQETNLAVPSVAACVASAVRRWAFPLPADAPETIAVNYPFTLSPVTL